MALALLPDSRFEKSVYELALLAKKSRQRGALWVATVQKQLQYIDNMFYCDSNLIIIVQLGSRIIKLIILRPSVWNRSLWNKSIQHILINKSLTCSHFKKKKTSWFVRFFFLYFIIAVIYGYSTSYDFKSFSLRHTVTTDYTYILYSSSNSLT